MNNMTIIELYKKTYGLQEMIIHRSAYDDPMFANEIFDMINKKFSNDPEYNSIIDADDHKHYNRDMTKPSYFVRKYTISRNSSYDDMIKLL
jgi:hypothetical protein